MFIKLYFTCWKPHGNKCMLTLWVTFLNAYYTHRNTYLNKKMLYTLSLCVTWHQKRIIFFLNDRNPIGKNLLEKENRIFFKEGNLIPVWILTLCSLDVNWSLTVNMWPFSISFDLGSFVRTRCVGLPQARDCRARTSSLSGISVSCWISWNFIRLT